MATRSCAGWASARTRSTCGTGRSSWSPGPSSTCRSTGCPSLALRLGLTIVAADLSLRLIENPIGTAPSALVDAPEPRPGPRTIARPPARPARRRRTVACPARVHGALLAATPGAGIARIATPRHARPARRRFVACAQSDRRPGQRQPLERDRCGREPERGHPALGRGRRHCLAQAGQAPAGRRLSGEHAGAQLAAGRGQVVQRDPPLARGLRILTRPDDQHALPPEHGRVLGLDQPLDNAGGQEQSSDHAGRARSLGCLPPPGQWDVGAVPLGGLGRSLDRPAGQAHRHPARGRQPGRAPGDPRYRPISSGGRAALPERGNDSRTRHLDSLLKAAAAADRGHVFYIEPPADFCTNQKIATDSTHRWDGVHYGGKVPPWRSRTSPHSCWRSRALSSANPPASGG